MSNQDIGVILDDPPIESHSSCECSEVLNRGCQREEHAIKTVLHIILLDSIDVSPLLFCTNYFNQRLDKLGNNIILNAVFLFMQCFLFLILVMH